MFCSNSTYQKIDQDDLRDNRLTLCWVTQTVQKILWCFVAHISDWLKKLLQCRPKKKPSHRQCQSSFFLNIIMNPASKIASTNWIDNKWRETNWKGLVGVNPDPVGRPTKGQFFSEWIYGVIVSPKIRSKNCQIHCPHYTGQKSWQFFLVFWEKRWLHKFILKLSHL